MEDAENEIETRCGGGEVVAACSANAADVAPVGSKGGVPSIVHLEPPKSLPEAGYGVIVGVMA